MRLARKLAGVLLLVVLLGYPAMACLTSAAAQMTEAERECCKHMAQQCGSMNMPSSHSCCQAEVQQPRPMLHVATTHITPLVATDAAVIDVANCSLAYAEFPFFQLHPPPESPPGTPSILRI